MLPLFWLALPTALFACVVVWRVRTMTAPERVPRKKRRSAQFMLISHDEVERRLDEALREIPTAPPSGDQRHT